MQCLRCLSSHCLSYSICPVASITKQLPKLHADDFCLSLQDYNASKHKGGHHDKKHELMLQLKRPCLKSAELLEVAEVPKQLRKAHGSKAFRSVTALHSMLQEHTALQLCYCLIRLQTSCGPMCTKHYHQLRLQACNQHSCSSSGSLKLAMLCREMSRKCHPDKVAEHEKAAAHVVFNYIRRAADLLA